MNKPYISKSQYMTWLQCGKALWLKKHRKDLIAETDIFSASIMEGGIEVGKLARGLYPDGVLINAKPWEYDKSVWLTKEAIAKGADIIYEAAAVSHDGGYSRVDILRKSPDTDSWNIIEVKSSTKISDTILKDIAFQHYVFTEAGYTIARCFVVYINNKYERDGDIDIYQLFLEKDITEKVVDDGISERIATLRRNIQQESEPECAIGFQCDSPYGCSFKDYCWHDVPDYSVFNVYKKKKAMDVARQITSYNVEDIPADLFPDGNKGLELKSYLENTVFIDRGKVKEFLDSLVYPLYYLDYETISAAIPLFDKSKPYQQIPFQFSLHIEEYAGADLKHIEFLHWEKGTDPRYDLAKKLVDSCGDKGSVIIYFERFEKSRNSELAYRFPEFADRINAINNRIIDLYLPFKNRHLYHPKQKGSASIKYVLPAFTDLSYEEMDIANGGEASQNYLKFHKGTYPESEHEKLFSDLISYCELDTYAMVKLVRFLREVVG